MWTETVTFSMPAQDDYSFLPGMSVTLVIEGGAKVERVTCNGETVPVDCVFILRPALAPTDVFPNIAVENGYVAVNRKMATNLPGVFAAGDCTGGPLQVSKAAGEGLIAGQSAAAYVAELARKKA